MATGHVGVAGCERRDVVAPAVERQLGDAGMNGARDLMKQLFGGDQAQMREFLFTNSVDLYGALNPDFFTGTAVERDVAAARAAN